MATSTKIRSRSSLYKRRLRNTGLMVAILAMIGAWLYHQNQNLQRDSFTSGYLLFGAILFLTAYNVRKFLPFIPWLGSSASWMQLHIYVGLGSSFVFLWHIGWKVPDGILESLLAGLYSVVFVSGLIGLLWTRTIPRRLTAVGEQVVFEQIPLLRRQLVGQVRDILFQSPAKSVVLCQFYVNRLAKFFECGRPVSYLIRPTGQTCRALLSEIEDLDRYLSQPQRETGRKLAELVRRKDDLDYHLALQGRLRIWLFAHIGLTYSLVIIATVHGVMAHAFQGGLA